MPISLDIKQYCVDCPNFEPNVDIVDDFVKRSEE